MIPGYRIVDISLELAEDLPCSWPGSVQYRHPLLNWFDASPFRTHSLALAEHTGTHFDAPNHWITGQGLADRTPASPVRVRQVRSRPIACRSNS